MEFNFCDSIIFKVIISFITVIIAFFAIFDRMFRAIKDVGIFFMTNPGEGFISEDDDKTITE